MIKGARRVKDLIRNKAEGDSSRSQALLRHYAMERFLERLANSPYRDNFVLKGGMLMSSLVGVDQRSTMDIDISTGDAITPAEVMHRYRLMFEDRDIGIWAYPVETVLAEKIETALARGTLNTRMRDFYDVCMLRELDESLEPSSLRAALEATIEKRGSGVSVSSYAQTLAEIEGSATMAERWRFYGLSNPYASSRACRPIYPGAPG